MLDSEKLVGRGFRLERTLALDFVAKFGSDVSPSPGGVTMSLELLTCELAP